jgi:SAM-dependent methyltransferase
LGYDTHYENSLHFSPRFQAYAEKLAQRLVQEYDLHDKDVIEIGCGKGDFLALLCALGPNRGLGFDPSYEFDRRSSETTNHFRVIKDFFSERYRHYPADLICCRQVLEHIEQPKSFLKSVRRTIGDRTESGVFFEVPDVLYSLRDMGIWDLIYEHCGYFNKASLDHLFRTSGFKVLNLLPGFGGQFLCIYAKPNGTGGFTTEQALGSMKDFNVYANAFADKYREKIEHWEAELERVLQNNQRTVIWGGGSKGVTFLNVLPNSGQVRYVVDINPHKQGRFLPGTGHEIVPPEFLVDFQPQVVLVMNPNYLIEVKDRAAQLNIAPQFMVV